MEELSHWNLRLPWAFDEAVCQTRTVSNLYVAVLGLAYIAAGESELLAQLRELTAHASTFCPAQEETLSALAQGAWTKAVVLGDSGMAGLMEEGALAAVKPADTPFLNRVRSLPGARLCHITPDNREELHLRLRPEVV